MLVQKSFHETLEEVQTIIAPIRYSQENILGKESVFTKDPTNGFYKITNFYRNSGKLDFGTCGELTLAVFNHLQSDVEAFGPIKSLMICNGRDGGRDGIIREFSGEHDTHMFLLASPEINLMQQTEIIDIRQDTRILRDLKSAFIIDPSFNKIIPYEESGYTIKRICKGNLEYSKKPEDKIFQEMEDDIPIFKTEKGEILGLVYAGEHDLCLTRPDRYDNIESDSGTFFSLSQPDPLLEGKANKSKILYWYLTFRRE